MESNKKKRVRVEWTSEENKIFSDAIRNKLSYGQIHKLLPNRTINQIRTHYKYFSKGLQQNDNGKKKIRLGKRGRPKNSSKYELFDQNKIEFQKIIKESINNYTSCNEPKVEKPYKTFTFNVCENELTEKKPFENYAFDFHQNGQIYICTPIIDSNFSISTGLLL